MLKIIIGCKNNKVVDSKDVTNQIKEALKLNLDVVYKDNLLKNLTWEDLYNDDNKSLLRSIYCDRKKRVDKHNIMADRPNFAVCTVKNDTVIRLEYYEGHDYLELVYDFRRKDLIDKNIEPYLKEDINGYKPYVIDENFREILEIMHEISDGKLDMKDKKIDEAIKRLKAFE